jgi:hypothetical protein
MPVGRISFLFMGPLSFHEFLIASGQERLCQYLENASLAAGIDSLFCKELEKLLRNYLIIGGMPGVAHEYLRGASPEEIQILQTSLLNTYQVDFAKYASTSQHKYLKDVFLSAPRMVGRKYKYSQVNPNVQSRDLKNALQLLTEAHCLYKINHSSGHGVPLAAQTNEKKFKVLFLDVGLMQRALGLDSQLMFEDNFMAVNMGSVVEQFVGQELLAEASCYDERNAYFWSRESKSSSAETDYLVISGPKVYPAEVKSGKTGKLKSLRMFLDEHPDSALGIRFSRHDLSLHDRVLSIPLYMIRHWQRFVKEAF